MTKVRVLYFASLRDAAGRGEDIVETDATDLRGLYDELRAQHGFALPRDRLRVAVDGAFARWEQPVHENAEIVFVPPVSGG